MKLPAFQFYPGDWIRDPVSGCSLAAQGLWLRMMILAHDSDRYGYLEQNGAAIPPEHIARRCGSPLEQYTSLLLELDAAGVPSRTPEGTLYSRRMVRDAKEREGNRKRQRRFRSNGYVTPPVTQLSEGEGEVECEVNLPKGFPESVDDAVRLAGSGGWPDLFAIDAWNKARARGGRDSKDVPIRSWTHYVAREWSYEQQRKEKEKHANNGATNRGRADRNAGTLNEGKSGQYRGVGKVVPLPVAQRPTTGTDGEAGSRVRIGD